jgi:hypothetical protein
MNLLAGYENDLSQVIGKELSITHPHIYNEQNGDKTTCITGTAEGKSFRLAKSNGKVVADPSEAKWIAVGCTRPNYQLVH